jgi:hypothetical protein
VSRANQRANPAIRLRVPDGSLVAFDDLVHGRQSQDVAREVGDFVLKRADGYWAYQLAVVVDDAEQGITDVVRGADLLDSTPGRSCCSARSACPRRATHTCRWCWAGTDASCPSRTPRCRSIPSTRCRRCARPGAGWARRRMHCSALATCRRCS